MTSLSTSQELHKELAETDEYKKAQEAFNESQDNGA